MRLSFPFQIPLEIDILRAAFRKSGPAVFLCAAGLIFCAYAAEAAPSGAADAQAEAAAAPPAAAAYPAPDVSSAAAPPVKVLRPETFQSAGTYVYGNTTPETSLNEQLGIALVKTAEKAAIKAGSLAKTVGQSIGEYMKERQTQKAQEDLVQKFYYYVNYYLTPYHLDSAARSKVVARVEQIYIDDGAKEKYALDTVQFREMPGVVRKAYGDIQLDTARNGEVKTYYINGRVETVWNLKNGVPDGAVVTYYEKTGEIQTIDLYENGRKLSRKKYNEEGKLEFEQKYDYEPEKQPAVIPVQAPAAPAVSSGGSAAAVPAAKSQDTAAEAAPPASAALAE